MLKLLDAPPAAPSVKNVMDATQKYLPVHEQCSALRIEPYTPVAPDGLLNSLFPESTNEKCRCETGKAAEINGYLDILTEMFDEYGSRSR